MMLERQNEYTLDLFVNQALASEYLCGICMDILEDPTDINCGNGHLFCKSCLNQLSQSKSIPIRQLTDDESVILVENDDDLSSSSLSVNSYQMDITIACPVCKQSTKPSDYHRSTFTERQIGKLQIFCPNHPKGSRLSPSNSNDAELIRNQIENALFTSNSNSNNGSRHFPESQPLVISSVRSTTSNSRSRARTASLSASARSRSRSRSRDRSSHRRRSQITHSNSNSNHDESDHKSSFGSNFIHSNNNGCLWSGQLIDLFRHLENECEFHLKKCEFCGKKVLRQNMSIHHEFECLEIKVKCLNNGCLHRIPRRLMDYHCSHQCEHRLVNCVNSECNIKVSLFNLTDHLDECKENPIQCEYLKYGCTANIKRKYKDLHNKNFETKHIKLKINALERMLKDKSEEIEDLRFEVDRIHQLKDEIERINQIIDSVTHTLINR